ncbi:MAG: hypothetical protein IKG46_03990 [Solobacterium sp.]|nr:hypothetical protein [Solobacterium sp.]
MRRILVTIMAAVMVMTITACGAEESQSSKEEQTSASAVEEVTENEKEENQESDTSTTEPDTVSETDMDIVLRSGHPTYYGSVAASHVVWDDVEKNRIHFADKNYGYNDNPILTMDAYRNSDIIRQVIINFTNFTDSTTVPLDDAIQIASSYMPYDVMDQYYEFSGSKLLVPDESRKDDDSYYVISYRLTDEGSKAYYAKEHEYSGSIDVIIQVNNETTKSIDITFGTPRWMSSLDKNNYSKEEWLCDLYDYR